MLTLAQWRSTGRPLVPVIVKEYMPSEFPPAGCALVCVLNGTGRLRQDWRRLLPEPYVDRLFFQEALTFDGKDLLRWRCSECPTCPHLLEAAGLSPQEVTAADAAINGWTLAGMAAACPRDWVNDYLPLLLLCEPGFYWVYVKEHFPTDGSGRFFWSEIPPDGPQDLLAYKWGAGSEDPAFLLATQQTSSFRPTSWEHARQSYQSHPGVTLFLRGYGSALLDGHHRATAAAAAGRSFPCVTFVPDWAGGYKTGFEAPLPPWGCLRPEKCEAPEEALDLSFPGTDGGEPRVPSPVQTDAPKLHPLPVAAEAQQGVTSLPTTSEWYCGVVLRHFFDGALTEEQWRTLMESYVVTSPVSARRTQIVSERGRETVEPSTYDLPLIEALIGLRALGDPAWPQRWEEALNILLDRISPDEHLQLYWFHPPPTFKQFVTELLARNEAKHPDLVADLRQRYKLD